jgi:hypothetical protein
MLGKAGLVEIPVGVCRDNDDTGSAVDEVLVN